MSQGCTGITVNPNTNQILAQSAGQMLGYKFAERNPQLCAPAVSLAAPVAQGSSSNEQVVQLAALAVGQFKTDPILALELSNLLLIIQLAPDPSGTTLYDPVLTQAAATGFIQGVQLYQSTILHGQKPYQLH